MHPIIQKLEKKLIVSCQALENEPLYKPEDLTNAFEAGVFTAVVGGAITRPKEITERFINVLPK